MSLDLDKGFLNWVGHNFHGMLSFWVLEFSRIAAHKRISAEFDVQEFRIFLWEWWALGIHTVPHLWSFPCFKPIPTRFWTSLGFFRCGTPG
jgi:hypothetical protein